MDPQTVQLAQFWANIATIVTGIGVVFAVGALVVGVRQAKAARDAVEAQGRAVEAQVKAVEAHSKATQMQLYTDLNMKFLDIISAFTDNINIDGTKVNDLTPTEHRAMDRWFYLASIEYALCKNGALDGNLARHMETAIEKTAKKPIWQERWHDRASKFTLQPEFIELFEKEAGKPKVQRTH